MSICVKQVSEDAAPALDLASACVQARCIRNEFCLCRQKRSKAVAVPGRIGRKVRDWRRGRDSITAISCKSLRNLNIAIIACVYAGFKHSFNFGSVACGDL
jgi:hypothetical protein